MLFRSALAFVACGRRDAVPAVLREEIAAVGNAIAPVEGTFESVDSPAREGIAISAGWTFVTKQPWEDYERTLRTRLGTLGYSASKAAERQGVFTKELPGDAYSVVVEHSGSAGRVNARFTARPN